MADHLCVLLSHSGIEIFIHLGLRFGEVYSYDPSTRCTRLESPRSNRLLMRRYAMVHKARDADIFGILVGTLGIGRSHERAPGRLGLTAQPCQHNIYPSLDAYGKSSPGVGRNLTRSLWES
jgi:hypothetical protein